MCPSEAHALFLSAFARHGNAWAIGKLLSVKVSRIKKSIKSTRQLVSFTAVIRVVTQRFSPLLVGEKRCVTTLITAAEETARQ